jgi:general secretion pathway protein G
MAGPVHKQGFSLVEVLIALVIVAIMGAVVALNVVGAADDAKVTATGAQIKILASAVTLFKSQQGYLPTQTQGLEALVKEPAAAKSFPQGGYLGSRDVPADAWGRPFLYLIPGRDNRPFEILSYGADGLEGGTGPDADISSAD